MNEISIYIIISIRSLSVHLFFVYLSVTFFHPSQFLHVRSLSVSQSVCLSFCTSRFFLFVTFFTCKKSVCLSVCQSRFFSSVRFFYLYLFPDLERQAERGPEGPNPWVFLNSKHNIYNLNLYRCTKVARKCLRSGCFLVKLDKIGIQLCLLDLGDIVRKYNACTSSNLP